MQIHTDKVDWWLLGARAGEEKRWGVNANEYRFLPGAMSMF